MSAMARNEPDDGGLAQRSSWHRSPGTSLSLNLGLYLGFRWGVVPRHATAALPFSPALPPPSGPVYPGMGRKGSGVKSGKERGINGLLHSSLQMFKVFKGPEKPIA